MRSLWSGLDAAAAPLAALLIAASLVRALGTDDYGVFVIALAVSAVSTAVSPAISATTTKFIAEHRAQAGGGTNSVATIVTTSLLFMVLFDVVLLTGAALFATPLSRFVFADAALARPDIEEILLLAVLAVCVQQIDIVLGAALKGLECFRQQALYEWFSKAVLVAAVAIVGWLTGNLVLVLLVYSAIYAASVVGRGCIVRRMAPDRRLFGRVTAQGLRTIAAFGGWMWLSAIATTAFVSLDRIIVGRVLGAAVAAQFSIYVQITQFAHFVPASLFAFLLPAFSRLSASGEAHKADLRDQYRRYFIVITTVALAIGATIAVLGGQLFHLMSGDPMPHEHETAFFLLSLGFVILALNICPYYLLVGSGRSREVAMVTVMFMLLALILMVPLTNEHGLTGTAIARFGYVLGTLLLIHRALQVTRKQ